MPSDEPTAADDLAEGWAQRELERVGADLPQAAEAESSDLDRLLAQEYRPVELFPDARTAIDRLNEMEALVKWMQAKVEPRFGEFVSMIYNENTKQKEPYPQVNWWTTMGLAVQLVPRLEGEVFEVEGHPGLYGATIIVVHLPTGHVVTRAQGFCDMAETTKYGNRRWSDEYAGRAMAQTRAIGRAFRGPLGGLAALAGLKSTPAEEMVGVKQEKRRAASKAATPKGAAPVAEAGQGDAVTRLSYQGEAIGADQIPTGQWVELFPINRIERGWLRCEHINGGIKVDGDYAPADDLVGKTPVVWVIRSGVKGGHPWAIIRPPRFKEAANDVTGEASPAPAGPPSASAPPAEGRVHKPTTGTTGDPVGDAMWAANDAGRRLIAAYSASREATLRAQVYGRDEHGAAHTHFGTPDAALLLEFRAKADVLIQEKGGE